MKMRSGAKLLAALGLLLLALPCQAGMIKVSIDGAVGDKGVHETESWETTLWAFMCKRKVSDIAVMEEVYVARKTPDGPVCYKVNLKKLVERSLDFCLEDGDQVFVREKGSADPLPAYTAKSTPVE